MDGKNSRASTPGGGGNPPEIDIPNLRKKEKERKGAGVPIPGIAAAGKTAASSGGLVGLGPVGSFMATLSGGMKALVANKIALAAVTMVLGGGGLVGVTAIKNWQAGQARDSGPKQLSPLTTTLKSPESMRKRGSRSLAILAKTTRGEVQWGRNDAPAPPKKQEQAPELPPELEQAEDDAVDGAGDEELQGGEGVEETSTFDEEGEKNELVTGRLGDQLGQGFGKNNIFSGGSGFDMKTNLDMGKTAKFRKSPAKNKAKGMKRGMAKNRASSLSTRKATSGRAMGQLRFAQRMSYTGAHHAGSDPAARQYAADAFEQGKTEGGEMEGIGIEDDSVVTPAGAGAPSINEDGTAGNLPETPDVGPGTNMTPYQHDIDMADTLSDAALAMLIVAALMAVIAAVLMKVGYTMITTGKAMVATGTSLQAMGAVPYVGPVLAAIGTALVASGTSMITTGTWYVVGGIAMLAGAIAMAIEAKKMGDEAKELGKSIEQDWGQEEQGQLVQDCADSAMAETECDPNTIEAPENTIQEDVEAEQESTYDME